MITWLKKHFVPHEGNGHRPHLLHGKTARAIVLMAIVLELGVFSTFALGVITNSPFLAAVLPAVLSALTNDERAAQGLGALSPNPVLDRAATLKAQDMASKGYFAHTSPEGVAPWHWLDQVGYDYEYAGENLAVNFVDSQDVTRAWMESPTHKANIVKASYTEVGTGIATGVYQGGDAVFVVQLYGKPVSRPVAAVTAPAASEPAEDQPVAMAEAEEAPAAPEAVPEPLPSVEDVSDVVLGAEAVAPAAVSEPTLLERAIASPRHTTNAIFFAIAGVVGLALVITVAVRFEHSHPDLVTNGLAVIALAFGAYVANGYMAHRDAAIPQAAATFEAFEALDLSDLSDR